MHLIQFIIQHKEFVGLLTGMQWLKGFLLTVTEETLGSRDDRLWFSVSSPLTADMNVSVY